MHALVIDDSAATRRILGRLLESLGIQVTEAPDGAAALEMLQEPGGFDLAIVDWNMPIMNGIEFIRAVRSEPGHDALKLLVVTSQTETERIAEALGAGADEFLMKPFAPESLLGKLELMDIPVA